MAPRFSFTDWLLTGVHEKLDAQGTLLATLLGKVNALMADVTKMRQDLAEINTSTNEAAAQLEDVNNDLDKLLALQSAPGGLSVEQADEVASKIATIKATNASLVEQLKATAAKYDSTSSGVDGGTGTANGPSDT